MSAIRIDGISKAFGSCQALADVTLSIDAGELFCLFGPPASGKTTLLRIMLGLETPDAGEVLVDGRRLRGLPPGERGLATVFQNLALFAHLTAYDNIAFPLRERRVGRGERDRRVREMSAKLKLDHVLQKRPAQLSGGERQRVAIGRALVRSSSAVLMDEPISALDARLREVMRVELKALQRGSGQTIIYVTHDQEEALSVADRICIMNAGVVEQVGRPEDIYNEPASRFVAEVMGSPRLNVFAAELSSDASSLTVDGLGLKVPLRATATSLIPEPMEVGIRPESFSLARSGSRALVCEVIHVEPLGGMTIVGGRVQGRPIRMTGSDFEGVGPGDTIPLSIAGEAVHVFDRRSGRRLQSARAF